MMRESFHLLGTTSYWEAMTATLFSKSTSSKLIHPLPNKRTNLTQKWRSDEFALMVLLELVANASDKTAQSLILSLILYDQQLILLLLRSLRCVTSSSRSIVNKTVFTQHSRRCRNRRFFGHGFSYLRHPKLVEPNELFFTHHVWDKFNLLLRHSKSFPLLIYNSVCSRYCSWCFLDNKKFSKSFAQRSGKDQRSKIAVVKIAKIEGKHCNNSMEKSLEKWQVDRTPDWRKDLREVLKPPTGYTRLYPGVERDIDVYAVARYPENHNPFLPLSMQKRLDEMPPREYLTYVLKELTLDERESLMVDERQRRKTFLVNWPHENNLSGVKMAQSGFYCIDGYDRVQCVFCRGSLHQWEREDNPMTEHARSFTFCRFIKGLECGNREYRGDLLTQDDLKNISFYRKPDMRKNRDSSVSTDSSLLGISTNRADIIRYAPNATRLRTYARWPASCPITAKRMCDAGFYFTGFEDQVRCFYCSGGLRSWQPTDDPWEEHARWFPECGYLLQQKGESYVAEVHARTPANKKLTLRTKMQKQKVSEQKQKESFQQDMVSVCKKLGHKMGDIQRVVRLHGKPFSNVGELVEALHQFEEDGQLPDGGQTADGIPMDGIQTVQAVIPEADRLTTYPETGAMSMAYGCMDQTNPYPDTKGSCIMCYRKIGQTVVANHIGLPCGHMIYCDNCHKEESHRAVNPTYKPLCPYKHCGAPLTASFKTFSA